MKDKASQRQLTSEQKKVVFASSLGTVFEWYDFYLYGSLASIISKQFFSGVNDAAAFIIALLAFSVGFAVRPLGAIIFGRLGDMVGRKHTFLITILIMGLSTFIVGLLPPYASIGIAAPIVLIGLRFLQGLALGGEYGGAVTYVAEYAPTRRRGLYTSWIQTTATMGLLLSLVVILLVRMLVGAEAFDEWGWRIPFLMSIALLGISVWIRMQLSESPTYLAMKAEGRTSKAPIKESFGQWKNLKLVLIALFGLTAGQGVIWYTGQFYALFFLTQNLKVDNGTANLLVGVSLVLAMPFFLFFGALSDRIGRKPIIMVGCLLAVILYFPLFKLLTHYANPTLERAQSSSPVVVMANPDECSFQFNLVDTKPLTTSCDIAKNYLSRKGINYTNEAIPAGMVASIKIGERIIPAYDANDLKVQKERALAFVRVVDESLQAAGYPNRANPFEINKLMVVVILFILVLLVTMVYGPIAAMLVEMFPTPIRYTSMSLPYHIGNGWFGGFLPAIAFAMVAAHGDIYQGLWYPIGVALMTFVIGMFFLKETKGVDVGAN
ncbi:MFS transporter [Hydromonas duriensis]|uniref:Putative MFS family arabinose efflux permease n=1 Tax=Hydromonas duriensis TaxID=1527608 RepID=A0A4V3DJU2_9BURK|nr:MFS transporter [Hydromonas duriensis]TDR30903.1 putative MFS family arabinose efflux permease [Hydromonas duriensis]